MGARAKLSEQLPPSDELDEERQELRRDCYKAVKAAVTGWPLRVDDAKQIAEVMKLLGLV